MSKKKIIHLLVCLFLLVFNSQAQTTYNFSTDAVISGMSQSWPWNTTANITIGGVNYVLTGGINGSYTNSPNGGSSNSKSLRKDGGGAESFTLRRADNQPFQFYGIWISHQSMNSYSQFQTLPPWYTISTTGTDSFTYSDMTPMTAGTAPNNYTSSSTAVSAGTSGKKVTSVTVSFQAVLSYNLDDIIVGPAAGANTVITANPANRTICAGGTTTFTVSAAGATSYQWYQNSGSGFIALTNTAPYSGVTTTTLTITGATSAMNGFQYRAVASGAGNATSTAAGLTVVSISTTGSKTDVACNGGFNGFATVVPSGGVAPYSYSWSPSGGTAATATGLSAGTYTVTVTDNSGCQTTRTFTINQPASAVSGTTVVTNVACNGASNGAINLTPAGGTPPYTFNWGDGVTTEDRTGLAAGTYTVVITDANGCTATVNATVTQPASAVSGTTVVTNVACNSASNGTINLTPGGGTAPYTFNWGGGVTTEDRTGLAAGTYTVVITDANGCTATVNATVTQPASAVSGTTVVTNVACNGASNGTINLTPGGGTAPYTFNWGGGVTTEDRTGLAAGTYTVVITDANGCTATVNATVTQPASAVSGTTVVTNVACNGASNGAINLTPGGGTAPYTFNWGGGVTTEDRTGLAAGTYTVVITDANGCTATVNATVTQPASAVSATTVVTNVACNGASNGAINLTPGGGTAPYTFNWGGGVTTEDRTGLAAGTYTVVITDANGCTATVNATVTQPTAMSATVSQTNISCNGGSNGSAGIVVSGGTAPYTYSWSPSGGTAATATGLAAGTYTVTVTDANACTLTRTVTITQPTAMSATVSQTNISCNGGSNGSAGIVVSGGTAPYTYSWSPSGGTAATATGLAAGTYTVTVTDANACTLTRTVTITQPTAMSATVSQTNISCNGGSNGSAGIVVSGGTAPYTYSWSPSGGTAATATGLAAGTYTVTVTDANTCTLTRTVTITQPAASVSGTTVVTNIACNGASTGAINLTPGGGTAPYTFNWGGGITTEDRTGLAAGTYTVVITDANGCTATVNATVTQPTAMSATVSQTNISCNGGSNGSAGIVVSGGTAPYTYSWSPSGGTAATATGLAAGTYTVTVTDANACTLTRTVTITQPAASVSGTTVVTNIACNSASTGAINLTPGGGTAPYTFNWGGGITTEDRTGLAAGTYTVVITDANGCTATVNATVTQPTAMSATVSQTNISCNGGSNGSAGIVVSGGTAPYTYSWSPSGGTAATATGLAAGTYTVTVTDANACTLTRTVTITQPAASVSGTTVVTNIACNSASTGAINLTPSGGTAPYTFNWGGGITTEDRTGLAAGTYTVIITDANGCTATVNATVTQPTAMSATVSQTNISCNGGSNGSAGIVVSGGTAPYTYSWSPSGGTAATATGLAAGTYTVTVTDANACTLTRTVTITQPAALAAIMNSTKVSCPGRSDGKASVQVSGGVPPYNYSWNNGFTSAEINNLTQGTYNVLITDSNGCTLSKQIFVDTTADVTKPVPVMASLPTITKECAVRTADIPVPTANDNCAGIITATTTDALAYTAQGTYTINWTYNDGNGNTATQQQTIVVDDVTVPVPAVATLPTITKECAVTAADIPTPTANDNCAGIIMATTTDALVYTTQGTYTINWTYNDGNGNTATQQQTIVVDDVTVPVPAVATLPTITKECAVTAEDIPVPTANDNCAGMITATTTDALVYTAQGSYTINWTYNDGNGNTATQQQTIVVDDVTAPVPAVASLPTITRECAVIAADIPVPTANDNCAGVITATTTDALAYTAQGTYTINWTYNDGNGNTYVQQQTVIVEESPLAAIVLNDLTTVYNGTVHNLMVANMPAGAAVSYSIAPQAEEDNGAVNAGTYTVTAVVTPPASAVNCEPVTLTAQLVIEKAAQNIQFDELEVVLLETAADFQLDATASSGLPVTYTYTYDQSTPAATVSPEGWVEILHSGSVLITAHQQGDSNYLPAASVERSLIIESKDASIQQIVVNGVVYTDPDTVIYYMLDCNDTTNEVPVQIVAEFGATVSPARDFVIGIPKPGVYRNTVEVVSEDGTSVQRYQIIVERPFAFDDIVVQKFDNTLLINNNPQTNGGYRFVKYEWYRNDVLIGTEQVYSAGNSKQDILDVNALYRAVLTTENGDVIHTCGAQITRKHNFKINVYPNPVRVNEQLQVVFDYPSAAFKGASASLYTTSGKLLQSVKLNENVSSVQLPAGLSEGIYMLVLQIEGRQETVKVVVKQ